jgi:hypothetical protein
MGAAPHLAVRPRVRSRRASVSLPTRVFVLLTFPLSTHAIAHPCDAAGAPGRRCRASEGAVQAAAVTFCPTGVSFGLMAILGRSSVRRGRTVQRPHRVQQRAARERLAERQVLTIKVRCYAGQVRRSPSAAAPDEVRRTRADDGAKWRFLMEQVVQVFGSLLILAAFVAAQRGALRTTSPFYLVLNLVGSAILAVLAAHAQQWGFLLLEAVWALVSGRALAERFRSGESPRVADA